MTIINIVIFSVLGLLIFVMLCVMIDSLLEIIEDKIKYKQEVK